MRKNTSRVFGIISFSFPKRGRPEDLYFVTHNLGNDGGMKVA
jgi:hypothetical protein